MDYSYQIIYSKRRTISLQVARDGSLVVRAPKVVTQNKIAEFVGKQQDWINKTLSKVQASMAAQKQFADGEKFLYLGDEYPLEIIDEYRSRLQFDSNFKLSKFKQLSARKLFEEWYRVQALQIISNACTLYAPKMGVSYKRVTIKDTGSRWGSCSSLGNLNFSYRLVMAPVEIVEYVVVHELAHLRHQNHSLQFWRLVSQHCPHFAQSRRWLRGHGHTLRF